MAKSIIDELMGLLSPEEQALVRAKMAANPQLVVRDRQMEDLFGVYFGDNGEGDGGAVSAPAPGTAPAPAPAAVTHVPTLPSAAAAAQAPAPVTSPTADPAAGNSAILEKLNALSTMLDTRITELKKDFVSASDVPKYVATAIKASDNYAQIREDHRAEFNEPLNRGEFERFVAAQNAAGFRFLDDPADQENAKTGMKKAHDAFVQAKRTARQIETGVAEGVKQKMSAMTVPGQTPASSMSAAQSILAKAKNDATAAGGDGKTSAMRAAERLAAFAHARDNGEVVQ